jgi:hypothetical protein
VTALLAAFLTGTALLWLSVFGYLLALLALAGHRHWRRQPVTDLPSIVVLMATLNEIDGIDAKLADLLRVDYPTDRLRLMIVDGGRPTHGARIEAAAPPATIEPLRAPISGRSSSSCATRWRARRGDRRHHRRRHRLDPAARSVELLVSDPSTAVAAPASAPTQPSRSASRWCLHLWWLEGEAPSAAVVSGVLRVRDACSSRRRTPKGGRHPVALVAAPTATACASAAAPARSRPACRTR